MYSSGYRASVYGGENQGKSHDIICQYRANVKTLNLYPKLPALLHNWKRANYSRDNRQCVETITGGT